MAKHKLDLEPVPDTNVIGISSHVNDYRICWALNRSLGVQLTRRKDDIVMPDGGSSARFSAYDHVDEDSGALLTLIGNRSEGAWLLKEQKHADYFLVVDVRGPITAEAALERVRNTEFVLAAFMLDLKRLRSGLELFA